MKNTFSSLLPTIKRFNEMGDNNSMSVDIAQTIFTNVENIISKIVTTSYNKKHMYSISDAYQQCHIFCMVIQKIVSCCVIHRIRGYKFD